MIEAEIEKLRTENAALKKEKDYSEIIIRHPDPVITLNNDANNLFYCARCWDSDKKLIQLTVDLEDHSYRCQQCQAHGFMDGHKRNVKISY